MFKIILGTVLGLALGITGAANAMPERAHHEERVVAPHWMTVNCATEDSVNCYWDGGSKGPRLQEFVREMPGRTHMVCVIHVRRPALDYCA